MWGEALYQGTGDALLLLLLLLLMPALELARTVVGSSGRVLCDLEPSPQLPRASQQPHTNQQTTTHAQTTLSAGPTNGPNCVCVCVRECGGFQGVRGCLN